jgi:hypothetical protein
MRPWSGRAVRALATETSLFSNPSRFIQFGIVRIDFVYPSLLDVTLACISVNGSLAMKSPADADRTTFAPRPWLLKQLPSTEDRAHIICQD